MIPITTGGRKVRARPPAACAATRPGTRAETVTASGHQPPAGTQRVGGGLVSSIPTAGPAGPLDTKRTRSDRLDALRETGSPREESRARTSRGSVLAPTPNPAWFRFDFPQGDVLESTRDTGSDFAHPTIARPMSSSNFALHVWCILSCLVPFGCTDHSDSSVPKPVAAPATELTPDGVEPNGVEVATAFAYVSGLELSEEVATVLRDQGFDFSAFGGGSGKRAIKGTRGGMTFSTFGDSRPMVEFLMSEKLRRDPAWDAVRVFRVEPPSSNK